jgi:hypothetical protein
MIGSTIRFQSDSNQCTLSLGQDESYKIFICSLGMMVILNEQSSTRYCACCD